VHGLHLQFGADASSEVVVSWHTLQSVRSPRVVLGRRDGRFERTVIAAETSDKDAKSGQIVYAYHAKLTGLQPGFAYLYAALHEGAEPEFGTFRTVRERTHDGTNSLRADEAAGFNSRRHDCLTPL